MDIIVTHKNSDFDALASLVAATILYPDAIPVLPGNVNANVKAFLSIHKDLFEISSIREIDIDLVDRLIIVDTNNWNRLDIPDKLKNKKDLEICLWDHHEEGDIKADFKCQKEMGAAITLIVEEIQKKGIQFTSIQATLFLAGIYEDTGSLNFPSTKAADAYCTGYLIECGADISIVTSFLRPVYGEKQKEILYRLLKSAEREMIGGLSVCIREIDIKGYIGNLSIVVHMFRDVLNVDAAFCVFIDKERAVSIVIGRSRSEDLSIGSVMRKLGGGGHQGAGSAVIKTGKTEEISDKLHKLLKTGKFGAVKIFDLMSFPVLTVEGETSMAELKKILDKNRCTGVPVVNKKNKITGVISKRDFKRIKKGACLNSVPVKAYMSQNVKTIKSDISPMKAVRLMIKYDVGRLPVLSNNKLTGIVSRSDIMDYFYDFQKSEKII